MNIKQLSSASSSIQASFNSTTLTQILAVGSLAVGIGAVGYTAPAQAISLFNSGITFTSSSLETFFADVNPGAGDTITVKFISPLDVGSADGLLGAGSSFFPTPGMYGISPIPTAVFTYVSGDDNSFTYSLDSNLNINFTNGATVMVAGGTRFSGSKIAGESTSFSTLSRTGSLFKNGTDTVPLSALSFSFGDIVGRGTGGLVLTASSGSPTAVPEPFTIVGTIIGGTAALRMRKKLAKAAQK